MWQVREGELTHYGVKGMKWGVRKEYEPHPRKKKALTKQQKLRRAAIGVAAGAIAVGVGYTVARRIGVDYVGGVLKAGTTLQTITTSENLDYGRKFYAAFTNSDKKLYRKAMPSHYLSTNANKVYSAESVVSKSIKFPSNKEAEKIYNNLRKTNTKFSMYTDDDYNGFNTMMIGKDSVANKMFYDELKKHGYSALIDVNDQKGMGFGSSKPLIVFDSENLTKGIVKEVASLGKDDVRKLSAEGSSALITNQLLKTVKDYGGYVSAGLGANALAKIYADEKNQNNRRKQHESRF